ncbi:unnamed protein product [Lathyrus sativus]|nr:unnamed protein product [Lathyrus sativus]
MDLQKWIHEQLEIQRKLQIQIGNQGKHLQMMFEKHKHIGGIKGSPPSNAPSTALLDTTIPSHVDKLQTPSDECGEFKCNTKESFQNASRKEMVHEIDVIDEHESVDDQFSAVLPIKRAKIQ